MKQVFLSAMCMVFVGAAGFACDMDSAPPAKGAHHAPPPPNPAMHGAMEACATENNLTRPQPGSPPSDADRATMDACLKGKGFNPPAPPPEREAASDS